MLKISLDKLGKSLVRVIVFMLVLLMLSVILFIYGIGKNVYLTRYSSTAKGTMALFQRSNAKATVKNYFVDQNRDVLVAIIGLSEQVITPLPYNANDFLVVTDSKVNKSDVPIMFGRMGTDGDLFLIIPKPKQEIYDIVIANRNYLDYSTSGNTGQVGKLDLENKSLTKVISDSATFSERTETTENDQKKEGDSIRFRVGIKTAIDEERYSPTVLDVSSLLIEQNGKTDFDFETFWTMVYKQPLIDDVNSEMETVTKSLGELRSTLNSLQARLNENSKDETALSELSKVQNKITESEAKQVELSEMLTEYQSLTFDRKNFDDYITSMFSMKF